MAAIPGGHSGSRSSNDAGSNRIMACEGQGADTRNGGLALTLDLDLPVGSQIGVEFTPPYSEHPLTFRCFVRNRDGNRYGVKFITENVDDYRKAGELQVGVASMNANPLE